MTIENIRGKIQAYSNVMRLLEIGCKIHDPELVKRSNQFFEVEMGRKPLRMIKAWDMPQEMYNLIVEKIKDLKAHNL